MPLTGPQQRRLRALAHPLVPVVIIGAGRLSEGLLAEVNRALEHHELIKVRLQDGDQEELVATRQALCQAARAEPVQTIGHTLVLFRRNHLEPKLAPLPGEVVKRETAEERRAKAHARERAAARASTPKKGKATPKAARKPLRKPARKPARKPPRKPGRR